MRHFAAENLRLRGMGCADDRADGGIAVFADTSLAPLLDERAYIFVDGFTVLKLQILQFSARFIGGFDEHKDALVSLVHPI